MDPSNLLAKCTSFFTLGIRGGRRFESCQGLYVIAKHRKDGLKAVRGIMIQEDYRKNYRNKINGTGIFMSIYKYNYNVKACN